MFAAHLCVRETPRADLLQMFTSIECSIFPTRAMVALAAKERPGQRRDAMLEHNDDAAREADEGEVGAASELTRAIGNRFTEMNGHPLQWM